jgi:hypothetical protein
VVQTESLLVIYDFIRQKVNLIQSKRIRTIEIQAVLWLGKGNRRYEKLLKMEGSGYTVKIV